MSVASSEENYLPIEGGLKITRTQLNWLQRLPPGVAVFAVFVFSVFVGVILQLSSELMFRPHVALVMYVAGQAPPIANAAGALAATANLEKPKKLGPLMRPQFVTEELHSKWLSLGLVSIPSNVEAPSTQVKAISMTWGGELAKQFAHTNLEIKYGSKKMEVVYLNRTTHPTYAELILETLQGANNDTLNNEYKWIVWCHYQMYINTDILRNMLLAMDPSYPVVASVEQPNGGRIKVPPIIAMSFPAISVLSSRLDWVFWSPDGDTIEIQTHRLYLMGVKYVNLQDINKKLRPPAKKLLLEVNDELLIKQLTSIDALSESLTIGPINDPNLMFKLGYYLYEEQYSKLEKKLDDIVKYHNEMQNKVPARLSGYEVWPNDLNPPFKADNAEANIPWDDYSYKTAIETSSKLQQPSKAVKRPEKIAIQKMLTNTREACAVYLPQYSNASLLTVKEIKKHFCPGYGYEYRVIMTGIMTPSHENDDTVEETYLMKTAIPLGDPIREVIKETNKNLHLSIILSLSSVDDMFKHFMRNYEKQCLKKHLPLGITISLHVVTFQMFSMTELKKLVYHYVTDFPNANITIQEADDASNLMQAEYFKASAMDENPLLWFTNSSFQFTAEFIQQCALFPTKQKLFFPIPRNAEGTAWAIDSYANICGFASDITVANHYVETLVDETGDLSYDIFDWFVKHQSIELIRSPAPELMETNTSKKTPIYQPDTLLTI